MRVVTRLSLAQRFVQTVGADELLVGAGSRRRFLLHGDYHQASDIPWKTMHHYIHVQHITATSTMPIRQYRGEAPPCPTPAPGTPRAAALPTTASRPHASAHTHNAHTHTYLLSLVQAKLRRCHLDAVQILIPTRKSFRTNHANRTRAIRTTVRILSLGNRKFISFIYVYSRQ